MSSLNRVTLIGRVGQDPDIKSTANGKEIANLSIATSSTWTDKKTNERKSSTQWHRVVIFNENLVNLVKNYVKKGSQLLVEGCLETRKWNKDGQDVFVTEVVLKQFESQIILLDGKDDSAPTTQDKSKAKPQPTMSDIDDSIDF